MNKMPEEVDYEAAQKEYDAARREFEAANREVEKIASEVREQALESAKLAQNTFRIGSAGLTGTLMAWVFAQLFGWEVHSLWYYIPAIVFGVIFLGVAAFATVMKKKNEALLKELDEDLRKS